MQHEFLKDSDMGEERERYMQHEFLKDSDMGEERDTCNMSF